MPTQKEGSMRKMLMACGLPCNTAIVVAIYVALSSIVFYVGCRVIFM
jgi:hypothetical protein